MLEAISKSLGLSRMAELERFGGSVTKFGANFAVCSNYGELIILCEAGIFASDRKSIIESCMSVLEESGDKRAGPDAARTDSNRLSVIDGRFLVAVLTFAPVMQKFTALIDMGGKKSGCMTDRQPNCTHYEALSEMLNLLAEKCCAVANAEGQVDMVSNELSRAYEELVLLHRLGTNMRISEADASFLQMACDNLTDIVAVEGVAILLEKTADNEKRFSLAAGSGMIDADDRMTAMVYTMLTKEIKCGKEMLLDSSVYSPFKYSWPAGIRNIIALPLYGKDDSKVNFTGKKGNKNCIIGLMIAVNRLEKPDFDSVDIKLFDSVANNCAVFVDNGRLFKDLKELFIGSLRALTSSIDAKDPYTRGHSERVAFISRWIAEKIAEREPVTDEMINRVYLAGLLHDIGKVGISEKVLCKNGKLTEQEFSRIKMHPSIGADILGGIKQIRDIVPGVLHHHERVDGRGYPGGLVDKQISMIGKIIGLADSFDAMTSKRTYRNAMTVDEAIDEINRGLGTQFDRKIGEIFIENDIYQLWDIMQKGLVGTYKNGSISQYGAKGIGMLVE